MDIFNTLISESITRDTLQIFYLLNRTLKKKVFPKPFNTTTINRAYDFCSDGCCLDDIIHFARSLGLSLPVHLRFSGIFVWSALQCLEK